MRLIVLSIAAMFMVVVANSGCGQDAGRFPPSLSVENRSTGLIWNALIRMNGRTEGFGLVGSTFHKTVGFSLKDPSEISGSIFSLRISEDRKDVLPPWTEYNYELIDPVFPGKEVQESIKDVRFVYFEDGSAKVHFLGEDRKVVLGELKMKLKSTVTSETVGKDAAK